MDKAEEINSTLQPPLPFPEVRATARSIGRFMATRYKPKSSLASRRGVMNLGLMDISIKEKQSLSAKRTADIKADNSLHKIKQALKHWPEGKKITQTAVSHASGVCLRTVKNHWKSIL